MTARPRQRERVAARLRTLPNRVEPWMLFTDSGEMRRTAFQHGGFSDEYHGWTITLRGPQYRARSGSTTSPEFYRKADMYRWARDNSLTGRP